MKINDWFVGIVEDVNDPSGIGRVRIRCLGYHTPDRNQLPTIDLPLATIMLPTTSASTCGIGTSSTGLIANTWVFGFFRDAIELQDPVIIGTIASASGYDTGYDVTTNMGFGDPHGAFRDFIGSDIPPEAGSASSYSGTAVGNSANGANNSNNIQYNSNIGKTSFDSNSQPDPTIAAGSNDRLANVARSQLGITETSTNQGPGIEKYWTATSYKNGYNDRAKWCVAFVAWCIQQSNIIPDEQRPKTASVSELENWAIGKSFVQVRMNPRFILRGDIITFASYSHAGIADSNSDSNGSFNMIDGNSGSGTIKVNKRHISSIRCALTITNAASTNTLS